MIGAQPRACVVGWPIAHSRSPLIHGHWLERYGLSGSYGRHALAPDDAERFFADLGGHGYVGCNVTLPHKETAWRALDRATPIADRLRAANTLWLEDGILCGDNTDVYGFLANLDDRAGGWDSGGPALVIGAGGSARAVVHALVDRGLGPIHVLNRTRDRAVALAADIDGPISPAGLDTVNDAIAHATLVVNTTSAALKGEGDPLAIDWRRASSAALAADITYVPLMTPFLAAAAQAGLPVCDGLGMLLHQAVPGFERWFGRRPEVDNALRERVIADLEAG